MLAAPSLSTTRRAALGATLVTALALVLRLAYLAALEPPQETPGLSRKYQACAANVLEGHGFFLQVGQAPVPYVDRLPGYVALLAAVMAVTGLGGLAFGHALLGSLQAGAALLLARRVDPRAAWPAGIFVAAWPPLWKSDLQLVETGVSGAALLLLVTALLARRAGTSVAHDALVAGLGLAAVALRPDYLLIPPLVAAWQAWEARRRALRPVALTLLLPALACAGWAARNGRVADGAFVSVGLGTNLLAAIGESVATGAPTFGDQDVARAEGHSGLYWPNPATRDRARTRRALELIREHPVGYAKGCVRRLAVTLSQHPGRLWPGPTAEEHVKRWRAENPGRARYDGLFHAVASYAAEHPLAALGTFAWAPLALAGAALGAWRLRRSPSLVVALLALPAYGVAVHVPLHAEPRYFFPFLPFLLVLAAVAWVARREPAGATAAEA